MAGTSLFQWLKRGRGQGGRIPHRPHKRTVVRRQLSRSRLDVLEDRTLLDSSALSSAGLPALVADAGAYDPHTILVRVRPGAACTGIGRPRRSPRRW